MQCLLKQDAFQEVPATFVISDINSLSNRFCYPTLSASKFNLTVFLVGMVQY